MGSRLVLAAQMIGVQHAPQRCLEGLVRIGQQSGDAGERLVGLGVEDMKDGADQERMGGALPVIALLARAFGIDQDVGDVLDIAHLVRALPHLEQRVVARSLGIGRIEQQAMGELCPPAGGQLPVLTLDVMDDRAAGPGQQGRHHQAHALTRAGRGKGHDMLLPGMAQIAPADTAEEDAGITEQARPSDLAHGGKAGRAFPSGEGRG
jgi:hypothetical protein